MNRLHRVDARVGDAVRVLTRPGPRTNLFIAATTDLGSLFMVAPAAAVLVRRGQHRTAVEMTAAGGMAWVVGQRGKRAFNRRRPYQNEGIARLIPIPSGSSMPSGHAAAAAAVATVLAKGSRRGRRWPWALMALYVPITRVHLGVHYPGDTLVGACIGHALGRAVLALSARVAAPTAAEEDAAPTTIHRQDRVGALGDGQVEATGDGQVEAAGDRQQEAAADGRVEGRSRRDLHAGDR